jgi:hypothetical protein
MYVYKPSGESKANVAQAIRTCWIQPIIIFTLWMLIVQYSIFNDLEDHPFATVCACSDVSDLEDEHFIAGACACSTYHRCRFKRRCDSMFFLFFKRFENRKCLPFSHMVPGSLK